MRLRAVGHYDPLSSHEIDGVRKEKERLTAVTHTAWPTSLSYPLIIEDSDDNIVNYKKINAIGLKP